MGLYAALNSGLSGITAYQRSVEIVGNNISNVNNPDYSRQKSVLSTKPTLQVGKHHFGQGVELEDIKREYDVFVSNQILSESNQLGEEEVKSQPLEELERVLGIGDDTLASDIENFFNSWLDLTQNPGGEVERDYVIQQGQMLASSFDSVRDDLLTVKKNINDKLISKVDEINLDLQKIADLNKQIIQHEATGTTSNNLRDERNGLLEDVSKVLGAQTYESGDNSISVQLPGGLPLVQGKNAMSLKYEQEGINVSFKLDLGESDFEVSNRQFGGELKGLLNIRDELIPSLNEDLDKLEYNIVSRVNAQHQAGKGLNGSTGRAFFERFTSWESSNSFSSLEEEGFGTGDIVIKGASEDTLTVRESENSFAKDAKEFGSGDIEIEVGSDDPVNVSIEDTDTLEDIKEAINNSEVKAHASLVDDGGDYCLRLTPEETGKSISVDTDDLSGAVNSFGGFSEYEESESVSVPIDDSDSSLEGIKQAINSSDSGVLASIISENGAYRLSLTPEEEGQSIDVDINLSGNSQALGVFAKSSGVEEMSVAISETDSIAAGETSKPGDNTNAQAIADLADQKIVDGKETFQDFYSKIASTVGLEAQRNEMAFQGLEDAMVQLRNMRDSISGVSIDEEMVNLIMYQKGFEASSRMITTIDEMMETVLAMKR